MYSFDIFLTKLFSTLNYNIDQIILPVNVELKKMRMVLEFTGQKSSIDPCKTRSTFWQRSDLNKADDI